MNVFIENDDDKWTCGYCGERFTPETKSEHTAEKDGEKFIKEHGLYDVDQRLIPHMMIRKTIGLENWQNITFKKFS